jgi:hypothetical protein
MEEKNVQNPFVYSNRLPAVIDSDDVTFELGKLTLNRINNEKLLENLLKKNQELAKDLLKLQKNLPELQTKNVALVKSNDAYILHNQKLDEALVISREALKKKELEFIQFRESLKPKKTKNKIKPKKKLKSEAKSKVHDGGEW